MNSPHKMLTKEGDTSGPVHPLGPSQLVHLRATQSGTDGRSYTIVPSCRDSGKEEACKAGISAAVYPQRHCKLYAISAPSTEWDLATYPAVTKHKVPRSLLPVLLRPPSGRIHIPVASGFLAPSLSRWDVSGNQCLPLPPSNHSLTLGNPCSVFLNPLGTVPISVFSTVPGISHKGLSSVQLMQQLFIA